MSLAAVDGVVTRWHSSELSDGALQELRERKCHKLLTDEVREIAIRRVAKEELQVAHIVRLLKSRRQEEDDISASVAALRTVVANIESEVSVPTIEVNPIAWVVTACKGSVETTV